MIINLNDTSASEIASHIQHERRHTGAATGLVFTLIVVCRSRHLAEALEVATQAGREHPSRVIILVTGTGRKDKLDAEIRLAEDMPGEVITLKVGGEVAKHGQSVILPLLLPDSPVVAWWPYDSPDEPAEDPIGALANRRITDAAGSSDPLAALRVRARHHAPGDTDLTWARVTPWRALLAAALDQYPARITGVTVEADDDNAPAELLAAWLQSRLKVDVERLNSEGPGITGVRMHTHAGDVAILRTDGLMASYEVPGQPKRLVALKRRSLTELVTEELRRMDADDIFEDAILVLLDRWSHRGRKHRVAPSPDEPVGEIFPDDTATKIRAPKPRAARTSRPKDPRAGGDSQ